MFFFFQAEDGIRDLVRSRGLGDVYKRQAISILVLNYSDQWSLFLITFILAWLVLFLKPESFSKSFWYITALCVCLLYTSDAADERSSVDLGGRRIIKKK